SPSKRPCQILLLALSIAYIFSVDKYAFCPQTALPVKYVMKIICFESDKVRLFSFFQPSAVFQPQCKSRPESHTGQNFGGGQCLECEIGRASCRERARTARAAVRGDQ